MKVCPKCGEDELIMVFSAFKEDKPYWGIDCDSCGFTVRSEKSLNDARFLWEHAGDPNALRPCPFCGSVNLSLTQDNFGYWGVECHGNACHAYLSNAKWACERKEDAIAMWNRRVDE